MLKKQNRLKSDFEFRVTKKYGKRYSSDLFSVTACKPLNYTGETKIGFVVPNSYHKKATKRNYIKRLMRESVRTNINLIPNDYWIIFYPTLKSLNTNYEEINSEIVKTLQKIFISN